MSGALLSVQNLHKRFGGIVALDGFDCEVGAGELVGLLGPNGAGKTTLFDVLSGLQTADEGRAELAGVELLATAPHRRPQLGLHRTFQELRLIRAHSAVDNLALCRPQRRGERLLDVMAGPWLWRDAEEQRRAECRELLDDVGFAGDPDAPLGELSYGQQKLVSIAGALASEARLLLLDEPIAGVAPHVAARIMAVIGSLRRAGRAVLVIEHNYEAALAACDRIIFMDGGRRICTGPPDAIAADPRVVQAYLGH